MFMELYYREYGRFGAKRGEPISLPYAIRVPDREDRRRMEEMLTREGFEKVVGENGYPVMYVNFTLKRFGRNVMACGSSSINRELMSLTEFEELFSLYLTDGSCHERLSNNYKESAAIRNTAGKSAEKY